jgi:hypothetical protein
VLLRRRQLDRRVLLVDWAGRSGKSLPQAYRGHIYPSKVGTRSVIGPAREVESSRVLGQGFVILAVNG